MKKLIITFLAAFLLIGCANKEKTTLKEALLAKFKDDSDLKDYKLDPESIADCVVGEISGGLPGFAGDPRRERFFEAYTRFANAKSPADAEKAVTDYQQIFGSVKQARQAALSITDHVMTCMGKAVATADGGEKAGE
ncbi:hypothetical protein [Methylocaldum sp.]|uniref:hypothetical protein n=1 Tax=Methylocaldum sp. TaxID=1969727 RepID=UPI002D4FADC7|nr:hypothetical protein [Methylocaldum sp.]HYE35232.1 hypothetical protein [Methylocaldum sp.]